MESHPWWIAKDDIEPTTGTDVSEMDRKGEGQGAAVTQAPIFASEHRGAATQVGGMAALLGGGNATCAEQVATAHRDDEIATRGADRRHLALECGERDASFLAVELPDEGRLAPPGSACIALAQGPQPTAARREQRLAKVVCGERVADPDVAVEVRQRRFA